MKAIRTLLLVLLAAGLVTGAMERPAGAALLKQVSQVCQIVYNYPSTIWQRILPDGTLQSFALSPGQSLVINSIYYRFYDDIQNNGPYRVLIKAPNGTNVLALQASNITYPTTGSTVYGTVNTTIDTYNPGIMFSGLPTWEVRQFPPPPADPNSGPVRTGRMYMRITGYLVP